MRRILIIGLGSTGRDICDDIITRIVWSSGNNSLDRVPWVDLRVLETERQDGIPSTLHHKFVSLVPDAGEIQNMVSRPAAYDEQIDLPRWSDQSLLAGLPGLANGAGGIRMAGRLAFLAPSVYYRVKMSITAALQGLMRTTQADVNGLLPEMNGAITLEDTIQVCLVGTLCGGTASGCFLDAAHLVKKIAKDIGYEVDLSGYFTLPSLDAGDPVMAANTFAALQEWNHFLTLGTTYHVRYPDGGGLDHVPDQPMPFTFSYLLQTSPQVSYKTLKTQVGDYLYSLATSLDFSKLSGKTVDWNDYMNGLDKQGTTRRWATFGISTLDFPAERLSEGCSLKLVRTTLDRLLAAAPTGAPEALLDKVGLTAQSLRQQLDVEQLKQEIYQKLESQSEATPAQVGQALALTRTPDTRPGLCGLPTGYVTTTLGGRASEIRLNLAVKMGNKEFLSRNISLPTLTARLERLQEEIGKEIKRTENGNSNAETGAAKEELEAVLSAPASAQKRGCFNLFRRKSAVPAEQSDGKTQLNTLVGAVIEEHADSVCRREIYQSALGIITLWLERIDGLPNQPGLRQHIQDTREQIAERELRVRSDLKSAQINQVVPADIDQEYKDLLLRNASNTGTTEEVERSWQNDILICLDEFPAELLKTPGESIYDVPRDSAARRLRAEDASASLTQCAQSRFTGVLKRSVVDCLSDPGAALRWLTDGTEALNFDRYTDPQITPEPKQFITFLFYDKASVQSATLSKRTQFERELANLTSPGKNLQPVDGVNPHRISLVKEFAGFSINAIKGCEPGGQFRKAYENMNSRTGQGRHARRDVAWMPITADEMSTYNQACRMFLVGVASGLIKHAKDYQYEFHYRGTAPQTLRFTSKQWRDNGSDLYRDAFASTQLVMGLERWMGEVGPEGVVTAMRDYSNSQLMNSHLGDGKKELDADTFRQCAFQYWRPYKTVEAAFYKLDEANDPAQIYYREKGNIIGLSGREASRNGYYCLKCALFLGDDAQDNILYNPCKNCHDELLTNTRKL